MLADQAFRDGMRFFDQGNLEAAAGGFELALRMDAGHVEARYQLGNILKQQSQWAAAAAHYRETLRLAPTHAKAHNNLGAVLQMLGFGAEAEASYAQATIHAPALSQPYVNLGRLLVQAGRTGEAALWYRKGLEHCADGDTFGHLLAALGGAPTPTPSAPAAYVRETFDDFAAAFDQHLVGTLDYRVPEAIASALFALRAFAPAGADVLDLGCGTGLAGAPLRALARRLVGVDLAPKMLAAARARGCYDELAEADVLGWMRAAGAGSFDLIVAADVFIYLGDLSDVFAEAVRLLRPGGLLVFSIELSAGPDWVLQQSGRYAQSDGYIAGLAAGAGLAVAHRREQPIRKPLVGALYILSRS